MREELRIDDLAPGGEGVGQSRGRAVFVPFTAPGDRVVAEVPAGEGAAHGELVELLEAGPARVAPPCTHFGPAGDRCGGCEWLHAAGAVQLEAKARTLREALRRIGRIELDDATWRPPLASPEALRYRSRAKLHLDRGAGRLVFFRRRSHEPVPVERCHLLVPGLEALRAALGPAIVAAGLAPREVAIEWSALEGRGAAFLRLPAAGPRERGRAEALLAAVPSLGGLVLQAEGGAPLLVGDPVLRHERLPGDPSGGRCRSRPDVFQQANRPANALLVRAALDLLAPDGEEVLELFCGAGNFTGPLAARAKGVAAVEQQGPALDLARADLAGGNVRFFAGDALKLALAFAREAGPAARRFGAVLLDPPREGARGIGPALRALGVRRAVYVSCDPATLARDLRGCVEAGFRVEAVQAIDLFPQTHHVEGVVLLVDPAAAARGREPSREGEA
ncbi:MAG TPA: TRAM domain-containing protein [Anaeromyxobacteraceae bacterium]|nr:TRAM domain-containing protein [Anaeromyxobacteraceae bacterium]